jgi:hypothetical protein
VFENLTTVVNIGLSLVIMSSMTNFNYCAKYETYSPLRFH